VSFPDLLRDEPGIVHVFLQCTSRRRTAKGAIHLGELHAQYLLSLASDSGTNFLVQPEYLILLLF
jgi:hypothetical protein